MFLGARGAQAGADLVEVSVRVAGMADEFPGLAIGGGDGVEQGTEGGGDIGRARGKDAEGAGGRGEAGCPHAEQEAAMFGAKGNDGKATQARCFGCGAQSPGGFERIADRRNAAGAGGLEERAEDSGEKVGVLVGIDVGDAEPSGLETADLRGGFGGDLVGTDTAGEEVADEGGQSRAQLTAGGD